MSQGRGLKSGPKAGNRSTARGERRRREIAQVAEQVFLQNGFASTTMSSVAAKAGTSKETLYRHFGSKEDLFADVVIKRAYLLCKNIDADLDRIHAIPEVLRSFGLQLLTQMNSVDALCLLRLVIAEVSHSPEVGRIFFTLGPEQMRLRLVAYFEAARQRNEFHGDAALAASIFLASILGLTHIAKLMHVPAPSEDEDVRRVDEVVAMFLHRHGDGCRREAK